jgi:hypothetical protein
MLLFSRPEIIWGIAWARAWLAPLRRSRGPRARGQAVLEYMLLFVLLGMMAAVLYRVVAPVLEGMMVHMAKEWIAGKVAGEN